MKKLDEIPGKNPFKVPENYFEDVTRKILSDTSVYNHEPRNSGIFNRFRLYLAIAATVAVLVLLAYTGAKLFSPEVNNPQVSEDMLNENTESYINDIDLPTLEELASSLDTSEEVHGVGNNDIIDYLLLENIDINEIFNQL